MKSKSLLFAAGGLLAVIALFFSPSFFGREEPDPSAERSVLAPPFSLPTLNGETVRLTDFRGKVVVIDFWATWCPPCQEGIPELNRLQQEYGNSGLAVIGISLDRGGAGEVRRFLEGKGAEYVNVMGNEEVFLAYNGLPGFGTIKGIPTAFVIDREGRLQQKFVGLTRKQTFEAAIKPLL
jgi:thiol-disulfide isomerase/thioredoxin